MKKSKIDNLFEKVEDLEIKLGIKSSYEKWKQCDKLMLDTNYNCSESGCWVPGQKMGNCPMFDYNFKMNGYKFEFDPTIEKYCV